MQYLPLFLLFVAVLAAGYFYLQRAKARDAAVTMSPTASAKDSTAAATDQRAD